MSINLIPPQLKKQRRTLRLTGILFGLLLGLIFICILSTAAIYFLTRVSRNRAGNIESEIKKNEEEIVKLNPIKEEIEQINAKLTKIDSIDQERIRWSTVLTEMAKSTPAKVSLKTIVLNKENKSIVLTGEAENRQEIAKYKDRLEDSVYFKNVIFSTSSYNQQGQDYTFSLNAEIEKIK